jgi:hypothetical protein
MAVGKEMISIDLKDRDEDFKELCRKCRAYMGESRHCEVGCMGDALAYIKLRRKDGITASKAFDEWVKMKIPHKPDGEEIVADYLGVKDLDTVRELLREDENE